MRKIASALIVLLLAGLSPALAQTTATNVQSLINSSITTNGSGGITGAKLNNVLQNMLTVGQPAGTVGDLQTNAGGYFQALTPGAGVSSALALGANSSGGIGLVSGTPTVGNCLRWSSTGVQDSGNTCGLVLPTSQSAGTLTTSQSMLGITGTWNNSAVTFPGALSVNVTDTASGASSLLLDVQRNGASVFSVSKNGNVNAWSFVLGPVSFVANGGFPYFLTGAGLTTQLLNIGGWNIASGGQLAFTSSTANGTQDTILTRDAAGALALSNGANAQRFCAYNTWSSSGTNYERGCLDWQTNPNVLTIGTQNGGTGVARNLEFVVGGVNKADYGVTTSGYWTINSNLNVIGNIGNPTNQVGRVYAGTINNAPDNAEISFTANTLNFYAGASVANMTSAGLNMLGSAAVTTSATGWIKTTGTTVASLPAAATAGAGARAFVTDATACTFGSAVTGGGSVKCPVYTDGTSWLAGG